MNTEESITTKARPLLFASLLLIGLTLSSIHTITPFYTIFIWVIGFGATLHGAMCSIRSLAVTLWLVVTVTLACAMVILLGISPKGAITQYIEYTVVAGAIVSSGLLHQNILVTKNKVTIKKIREKFYLEWYPTLLEKSCDMRFFTAMFIFCWAVALPGMSVAGILESYGSIDHFLDSSQFTLLQVATIYLIWNNVGLIVYFIAMETVVKEEFLAWKDKKNWKKLLVKIRVPKENDTDEIVQAGDVPYREKDLV